MAVFSKEVLYMLSYSFYKKKNFFTDLKIFFLQDDDLISYFMKEKHGQASDRFLRISREEKLCNRFTGKQISHR